MVVSISFNSNKQVNAVFFYLVGVAGETTSFKAYVVFHPIDEEIIFNLKAYEELKFIKQTRCLPFVFISFSNFILNKKFFR